MASLPSGAPRVNYGRGAAFYAHNSRNVAGIRFGDTLRSIRGKAGILRSANALAWDAGVIERAHASGITHLEVVIHGGPTYRTSVENLLERGSLQHRYGLQRVLSLNYWTVDGREPDADASTMARDEPMQGALFDLSAGNRRAVYS